VTARCSHRQMTTLDLPTIPAHMQAATANIAAVGAVANAVNATNTNEVETSHSVTIDVCEPAVGPLAEDTCASEMSFCDLAESVALSDSASQVFLPRLMCSNFSALHAALGLDDDAYSTWKQDCEREDVPTEWREQLGNA